MRKQKKKGQQSKRLQQPKPDNNKGLVIKLTSKGPYSVCLRSIIDFLAEHEEDTVGSIERGILTKDMLLCNLNFLRRSIEIAQQNARRLDNRARGRGKEILQKTRIILRAMYDRVRHAYRAIEFPPPYVEGDNQSKRSWLIRHIAKAYKEANTHRRELELLTSEIDERAHEQQLAESEGVTINGDKAKVPLNVAEENTIEALGTNTLIGGDLAKKTGYPYNSNFKSTLSSLRKRGILGNKGRGYFVEPAYHFLLAKSDKSQD